SAARPRARSTRSGARPCAARTALTCWRIPALMLVFRAAPTGPAATPRARRQATTIRQRLGVLRTRASVSGPPDGGGTPFSGDAARCNGWYELSLGHAQRLGQLRPRRDLQLPIDAREVHLDRLRRDEERLRDVLVRQVVGRELGHAALARRQGLEAAQHQAPRPRAGRGQLGLGALLECRRAEPVREL